jgi:hypothetical protein
MLESIAKHGKGGGLEAAAKGGPVDLGPNDTLIRPLVSVAWGQEFPFWLGLSTTKCPSGYYVAGCVATAIAQIMSYWEYPTDYGPWALLKKYKHGSDFYPSPKDDPKEMAREMAEKNAATTLVANLFRQIGNGVGMSYGCEVSNANAVLAAAFLSWKKFSIKDFTPYNYSITEMIKLHVALTLKTIFFAYDCDYINPNKCHAWVIDGLAIKDGSFYINNNWGWDGKDNGYFPAGVYDPKPYNYQNVIIIGVSK